MHVTMFIQINKSCSKQGTAGMQCCVSYEQPEYEARLLQVHRCLQAIWMVGLAMYAAQENTGNLASYCGQSETYAWPIRSYGWVGSVCSSGRHGQCSYTMANEPPT